MLNILFRDPIVKFDDYLLIFILLRFKDDFWTFLNKNYNFLILHI